MTAATPTATAWCSACGRPATIVSTTIDPRYPLVRCHRVDADGTERGHGSVPGLVDPDAAELVRRQRSVKAATNAHAFHEAKGRANPICLRCQEKAPATKPRPHPYESIRNRYRLVSHLDLGHGDRTMLPMLHTRPYEDIARHHAGLHGDPTAL
jgi:hypothetical protein